MHEQWVKRTYHRELFGTLGLYAVLLVASIVFGRGMEEGILRTVFLMSPIIGVLLAIWAIARQLRRIDEFVRQITLENIAAAAGITAAFSMTYGFMEAAGYPRLSMFTIWMVLMGSWGIISFVRCRLPRE
jgi:hypothetical protein